MDIQFRDMRPADLSSLEKMINRIVEFNLDDRNIAMELLTIHATQPEQRDYLVLLAVDAQDSPLGYACYGPTPLTIGTFDLYWIAVDPDWAGQGIGSQLIRRVEYLVKATNGRLLVIETSSSPEYDKTRQFYLKNHYELAQVIQDFYREGEDRVTYLKRVG